MMASCLAGTCILTTSETGRICSASKRHNGPEDRAAVSQAGSCSGAPMNCRVPLASHGAAHANRRVLPLGMQARHLGGASFKPMAVCSVQNDGAGSGPRGPKLTVKVVEYFMLLEASPQCSEEELLAALGEMWTLQYLVPNVLCASAGAVVQVGDNPVSGPGVPPGPLSGFTHALHYRFGNVEVADGFRRSDKVREATATQLARRFDRIVELAAVVEVPNELGAIFRRGGAWEAGVEHVLVAEVASEDAAQGAAQFLAALGELATSSACGALLSSSGPVARIGVEEGGAAPMLAMVTQVPGVEGASAFVGLPPVQGLLEGRDSSGVLRPLMSLCFEVAPTEGRRSSSPADGRLP
ncbi:unnamed protein product [Ostreobium quekettii]|uniref:Uncharacterized protein n=1 Tax=Ostreobium quekettii TaxID=121088 RepID=A0A8S1IMD6_9CHLO|nr:unnamed protein product [Ostreobium quekettii]|eukprot:evm.model.scf_387.6 EVM.evm.TU.scf_387.6   scf_387:84776-87453(-)